MARPAETPVPDMEAPAPIDGSPCSRVTDMNGKDPPLLALELCKEPAAPGREGDLLITIRRASDHRVLWSDTADAVAQYHIVGEQTPPAVQIVIVHHVETDDDDNWENVDEDAYYVVDLQYAGGKLVEVNRFRDSGD